MHDMPNQTPVTGLTTRSWARVHGKIWGASIGPESHQLHPARAGASSISLPCRCLKI